MNQTAITDDLRQFLPTDPHLADLVELRTIAGGTEAEAYTWPRLMARLNQMILQRQAAMDQQPGDVPAAASVGAPTDLVTIEAFVGRVNARAEQNMQKTGRLEGMHYAAMKTELDALRMASQE